LLLPAPCLLWPLLARCFPVALQAWQWASWWECAVIAIAFATAWAACATLARCGEGPDARDKPAAPGGVPGDDRVDPSPERADSAEVVMMDMASGQLARSNPSAPSHFDSEVASGSFVFLHRPNQAEPAPADAGHPDPCAAGHVRPGEYFSGKRRNWEVRFKVVFKKRVPVSTLRVSTSPFERKPVGPVQVAVQRWVVGILGQLAQGLYNSAGDDPRGRPPSDVEEPITSFPLAEVDQYIAPSSGSSIDLMCESFSSTGVLKVHDPARLRSHLRELVFEAGETHMFAFWAPSRFFNIARWRLAMPLLSGKSIDSLNGPAPIFISCYVLKPGPAGESRHIQSRKETLIRIAVWPGQNPLPAERFKRLQGMVGGLHADGHRKDHSCRHIQQSGTCNLAGCYGCLMPCGEGICKIFHKGRLSPGSAGSD